MDHEQRNCTSDGSRRNQPIGRIRVEVHSRCNHQEAATEDDDGYDSRKAGRDGSDSPGLVDGMEVEGSGHWRSLAGLAEKMEV